ncbi:PREDICTED: SH2 domain-containing protein 2A [Pseudopodoces humilis]|uniref:SH2 domain-containing protein 2A n=1 Tax=Pseudopodoces humilis TaxID=181119 RepID=UPI0006B71BD7|nr:PREDICTED: SH2 domain-containing protein 2A [Pseudopodoces humilis]
MDDDRPLFTTFKPSGFWAPPAAQSLPEGDPWPERGALRARTRLWFEQTQAQRLGPEGELPTWFHGFISRREAEELLQDQPLGCFLVRFSESTIGFVLSYRGRDRCRHFVLEQLPDGRYAILGERSAHPELAELLRHHATVPVSPYPEFLTVPLPCGRDEPRGRTERPAGSDAAHSPLSQAPAKLPEYSPASLESLRAEGGSAREAPRAPPPLPPKSSSRGAARGLCSSSSSSAEPEAPYAQVRKEAPSPEPKYQQLMRFHVYAEPREDIPIPEEPIPFYAMARGWSPRASPRENIYSEVALARQDVPARLPVALQNTFSTLPSKPRPHRRLFRSVSSQDSKRRQLSVAPSTGTQVILNPELELDDAVYSQSSHREQQTTATAENVYEQLPGDCP